MERRLAAIFAADMVGYSRLMAADEAGTLARLKALRRDIIDPEITRAGGEIVKLTGDGMLVLFGSVVAAVEAAAAVQKAVASAEAATPAERRIAFRIGLHLGDVMLDEGDIYGDGVNIAARLEAEAEPGGATLSDDALRQVLGKTALSFINLGDLVLKNIPHPVAAHKVDLDPARLTPAEFEALTGEKLDLPDRPSVAVLPFQNMSGDPEQEFFTDGLAEDIITTLSRTTEFKVTARNSTFVYKGRAVDIRQVGRDLGVAHVLEGSVRAAGDRIRVTAQLIDVSTGEHVWANRYDRRLDDIFTVQDELNREIVVGINSALGTGEQARAWALLGGSLAAHEVFAELLREGHKFTLGGSRRAVELARQLMAVEPGHAGGRIAFAWHHTNAALFGAYEDRNAAIAEALLVIEGVLDEQPDNADALAARSHILMFLDRFDEAEAAARKACEIAPNVAENQAQLARVHHANGKFDAALRRIRAAIRLAPYFPDYFIGTLCQSYMGTGDLVRARAGSEHWVVRSPDKPAPWTRLAIVAAAQGDAERAREAVERLLTIAPGFSSGATANAAPFQHEADRVRLLNQLLAAGLPP